MNESPLLLTIPEAAKEMRIGRTRAFAMARDGRMPGIVKIGRSVRVSADALKDWVKAQAEQAQGNDGR